MANYYLDYEGGNDAGSGVSFATRWKTLSSGATAARIGPGDTIRIMGSPAVQSFGINGTWTSSKLEATKSITSSTNASPIVITLASHGYVTGDTVVVTGHTTNTNANGTWEIINLTSDTFRIYDPFSLTGSTGNGVGGATGTVRRRNNSRVTMASDIGVKNLASHGNVGNGRTAWTASANVTTSLNLTDFKEGDSSDSIVIGASFTTGLAAYKATTSTLASTCVTTSFWIKQTSGTVAVANDVSIRLCSDIAGATSIKTIPVPALVTLNRWTVVSFDTSGLSGNIQSVALYVGADKGAQTFLISNIIGSGSDQVDLSCLIGKNTGTGMDAEPWCPIQSINSTRIMLDGETNQTPISTTLRGYYGTTETVPTYFRKTIKTAIVSSTTIVQRITDSGTEASPIVFSGGWDRTDMSTQPSGLATFFDGQNSQGHGIDRSSQSYVTTDKISTVRYYTGYYGPATFGTISNAQCVGCSQAGFWTAFTFNQNSVSNCVAGFNNYGFWLNSIAQSNKVSNIKSVGNTNYGLALERSAINNVVTSGNIFNNGVDGIYFFQASQNTFKNINSWANNSNGVVASANGGSTNNTFINCSASSGNSTGWSLTGYNYLTNCTASGNTSSQFGSNPGVRGGDDGIYSMNHNGVSGDTVILMYAGSVVSTTSVRHTSSGIAWALAPTSTRDRPSDYPVTLKIATLAVAADTVVTVKAWLRRTNTGLTLGLRILADQIAGVSSDVLSPMTAAADTWEEVTLTFTPAANGVVKIQAYCYGGAYTGYVDDLTIAQAPLAAALTPTFGSTTATADGFTVQISNYDASYTWAGTATASGTVVVSGTGLVTVTNVAPGTSSTATITTTRIGYVGGTADVTETSVLGAALTPTFGSTTATADGFTVVISNYSSAYTWAGTATASGSVGITDNFDSTGLATITGVAANTSSTATITTTRTGYVGGTANVTETSLLAALNPTFGSTTATADGFTVQISNYDSAYTWSGTATASGTVVVSGTGLVTVTNVAPGTSSTATITTTRIGYVGGTADVTETSVLGAALTPTFGSTTATADGFTVVITNYDSNYTWGGTATSSGSVGIIDNYDSTGLATITGVAANTSSTATITTTRAGYTGGTADVTETSLLAALTPTFGSTTATSDGFTVQVTNYDASFFWSISGTGTITISGSGLITVTALAANTYTTVFVESQKAGYVTGLAEIAESSLIEALTPSFGSTTATSDGFTVQISNYDSSYTWAGTATSSGSVGITDNFDSTGLVTVTGVAPGTSATATITTTRTGFVGGSADVTETSLLAALTPTFGSTTPTSDGFTVQISNYDAAYTWAGTATASGSVAINGSGLVTVTNVAPGTTSTATITTTRIGYVSGTADEWETSTSP